MGILGDEHFVIQPPAPFALSFEEIINHALDDLSEGPKLPGHRILKLFLPAWPRILLSHLQRGLKERAAGGQCLRDQRTQLSRQRVDRLFDVNGAAIDFFASEDFGKSLQDVVTDHDLPPKYVVRACLAARTTK